MPWALPCSRCASQGVLVLGSGSMTHNLAEFFGGEREPAPYVLEFSRWIESAITHGSLKALLDYRARRHMPSVPIRRKTISCRCSSRWARWFWRGRRESRTT
jgi:hypothetical protein